ncbi:MAG TPA: serine/threonine-protein kinase, partial [Polyangiaceae bacterium]
MSSRSPGERREPGDVLEGTVINGKFRILSHLATGGMGKVYRAEQAPLGRLVAVKVLRQPTTVSDTQGSEFRKRFFREASILAKLQHANVVTLFDYGRIEGMEDERYFMAMEFLAGDTLAQRIKARGPLQVQESLRILRQIARGLREAHKLGAVHRDLKPSNVILVPDEDGGEVVKILDFGIGKLMDDVDQEITQEGAFLGSPKYIAPEQINERRVDARTDVYALGVIAFECVTGVVPFEGETNLETILAHNSKPVPWMVERSRVQVPEIIETFVRRCLEKEPSARPQSMEEVVRAIGEFERILFGSGSFGGRSGEPTPQSAPMRTQMTTDAGTLALPAATAPNTRPSIGTASPLTQSDSMRPLVAPAPASRWPLFVLAGAAVLVGVGLFAARVVVKNGAPSSASASPSASSALPPPAARSFTLVLDSRPSGADVLDGDQVLGTTPLQVTVDRA